MLLLFAHRFDAASAKKRLDIYLVESKQTGDAVEPKHATFDEAIHARLGNSEQLGNFIRCEQFSGVRRGRQRTDGHSGLGCR